MEITIVPTHQEEIHMKRWVTLLAIPALCAAGFGAWAVQDEAKDKAKAEQDNAKVEAQIKELESQREKIDSQLRDLYRKSGRPGRVRAFGPRIFVGEDMDKLSPEVREKIERALRESERAVDEATRNLPDFKLMIP